MPSPPKAKKADDEKKPAAPPADEKKEVAAMALAAASEVKKEEDKPAATDNNNDEKKDADAGFTAEQDAKLKEMKAENKTWKQIADALCVKPNEIFKLKARFKELQSAGANGGEAKTEDKKEEKKPAEENKKEEKKQAEENKPTNDGGKKGKKNNQGNNANNANVNVNKRAETTPNNDKPQVVRVMLEPDDLFDLEDLYLLAKIVKLDDEQRWGRIASRFLDKTGRVVHKDDIRVRMEGW